MVEQEAFVEEVGVDAVAEQSPGNSQDSPRGSVIGPSPRLRTPDGESGSSDRSAVYSTIRKRLGLNSSGGSEGSGAGSSRQGGGDRADASGSPVLPPPPKRRRIVRIYR